MLNVKKNSKTSILKQKLFLYLKKKPCIEARICVFYGYREFDLGLPNI